MSGKDGQTDPGIALRRAMTQDADSGDIPPGAICDFCQMPIPGEALTEGVDGTEYTFCTHACRHQLDQMDQTFTEYHGFRQVSLGVSGLDRYLPQGIPRNSFVLLSGEAGTRKDALGVELVWRTLERGEPAAIVSFTEPPVSVVQRFLDLGWNVFPALESDRFRIVDCFTPRIDHAERFHRRLNPWNRYISTVVDPQTSVVNDSSDPAAIRNKIENVTAGMDMVDRGLVLVDSLTEFGTLVQPIRAYDFVKDIRAYVAKGRFVPLVAGATVTTTEPDEFPHDLSYVVDGIVDLQLADSIVEDTMIRRARVRKMNGVLAITEWTAFEFTSGRGMVPFDPHAEIAKHTTDPAPPPDGHS